MLLEPCCRDLLPLGHKRQTKAFIVSANDMRRLGVNKGLFKFTTKVLDGVGGEACIHLSNPAK